MADTKISALTAGTALAGTEEIPGVQSATTVKFTPAQIRTYVQANMTAATITGGTVTDPATPFTITQTWNDAADTFIGADISITNTASASTSLPLRVQVGGSDVFKVFTNGVTFNTWNTQDGALSGYDSRANASGGATGRYLYMQGNGSPLINMSSAGYYGFNATSTPVNASSDTMIRRGGAGIVSIRGSSNSVGGAINFLEQTAPGAPSTNEVVIYAEDNGSGKTRLMARFATGAAQQIAIEP